MSRGLLIGMSLLGLSTLVFGTAFGLDRELARWAAGAEETETTVEPAVELLEPPDGNASSPSVVFVEDPLPPEPSRPLATSNNSSVTVPDFDRMRVDRARRLARELGVRLVARTEYDEPIEFDFARYYRIRPDTQSIAAGTLVAQGTTIRVGTYALADSFASGY